MPLTLDRRSQRIRIATLQRQASDVHPCPSSAAPSVQTTGRLQDLAGSDRDGASAGLTQDRRGMG